MLPALDAHGRMQLACFAPDCGKGHCLLGCSCSCVCPLNCGNMNAYEWHKFQHGPGCLVMMIVKAMWRNVHSNIDGAGG